MESQAWSRIKTSAVEPNVAVKNLLYTNWNIGNPSKDTATEATANPAKVWFGNRWFAQIPPRLHTFQITVRGGRKQYRPLQLGGTGKFEITDVLTVHIWVLPSVDLDLETAHTRMKAMLDEVLRIVKTLGGSAGSGIKQLIPSNVRDSSRLDRANPQLYYQIDITAILFEGIS